MNDIFSVSLADLTPPNLINDSNIKAVISALDPQIQSVSNDIKQLLFIPDIQSLNDKLLDYLAVQFHSDFYDLCESLQMKRDSVSDSLAWHMRKGTPSAILKALKAIGIDGEFIPWWMFGGQLYTFRIKANITGDFYRGLGRNRITSLITRAVNESKSARSLMTGLDTLLNFREFISAFAALPIITSGNMQLHMIDSDNYLQSVIYYAQTQTRTESIIIRPHVCKSVLSYVYFGHIRYEALNFTIGVDLAVMYELIAQFEKRNNERFDRLEDRLVNLILKVEGKIDALDKKNDLLHQWKGDDEPI